MRVSDRAIGLSDSQRAIAAIIEDVLDGAGFPSAIIAAAIVNAHAESGLNPRAVGDNGDSVGLFQLNIRGLGAGMTTEARMDPRVNTEVIARALRGSTGAPVMAAYNAGERSVPVLTGLFTKYVERPARADIVAASRAVTATRMFPTSLGEHQWLPSRSTAKTVGIGLIVLSGIVATVALVNARRNG